MPRGLPRFLETYSPSWQLSFILLSRGCDSIGLNEQNGCTRLTGWGNCQTCCGVGGLYPVPGRSQVIRSAVGPCSGRRNEAYGALTCENGARPREQK